MEDINSKMESIKKFSAKLERFAIDLPREEKKYMELYCKTVRLGVENGILDNIFGKHDPLLELVKVKAREEEKEFAKTRGDCDGGVSVITLQSVLLLAGRPELVRKK